MVFLARECEHCGGFVFTLPGECRLYHPAVVSCFHERGVDATERRCGNSASSPTPNGRRSAARTPDTVVRNDLPVTARTGSASTGKRLRTTV